jgi:predicted transcriptional regulator YheO
LSRVTIFGKEVVSLHQFAKRFLEEYVQSMGINLMQLNFEGRRYVVRDLKEMGYFDLRDSVDIFAEMSGTSRVTIYADLKNAKEHGIF